MYFKRSACCASTSRTGLRLVLLLGNNPRSWVSCSFCIVRDLCWFQTNLPLAALPLRRLASLAVSELQLSAATPLWLFTERQSLPSWIEFNCLRSAAVGKAARLSIYWLDATCRLVIPLRQVTASDACAVELISSSKRQCGKRQVSLKPALLLPAAKLG